MAFTDPNAPVIARLFATDVAPNPRIEIDSYRTEGVISGGQVRFYGPGWNAASAATLELVTSGLDPNLDSVLSIKGPDHLSASPASINMFQFTDGHNEIRIANQTTLDSDSHINIDGKMAVNDVRTTQTTMQHGSGSFITAADGSIDIPVDPNLGGKPVTAFVSFQNSTQIGSADLVVSTAANVHVPVRSITSAGALLAGGVTVVCRYLFLS